MSSGGSTQGSHRRTRWPHTGLRLPGRRREHSSSPARSPSGSPPPANRPGWTRWHSRHGPERRCSLRPTRDRRGHQRCRRARPCRPGVCWGSPGCSGTGRLSSRAPCARTSRGRCRVRSRRTRWHRGMPCGPSPRWHRGGRAAQRGNRRVPRCGRPVWPQRRRRACVYGRAGPQVPPRPPLCARHLVLYPHILQWLRAAPTGACASRTQRTCRP